MQLGKWHHIAFTLNGSIGTVYVDGEVTGKGTIYIPRNIVRDVAHFGADEGPNETPDAEFDGIKFFNVSLSQTEIRKVLNMYE